MTGMKRNKIIDEAKQLVLSEGPSNILEFGDEYVADRQRGANWTNDEAKAILEEAVRQARRVYNFLGYDPVW
jgi:hypothetical protein